MSNNKQSSVEWYINNLIEILGDEICNKLTIEQINKIHNLGNESVAKHKEEIVESWSNGYDEEDRATSNPIKYYELTFRGNNEQQ